MYSLPTEYCTHKHVMYIVYVHANVYIYFDECNFPNVCMYCTDINNYCVGVCIIWTVTAPPQCIYIKCQGFCLGKDKPLSVQ